MSAPTEYGAGGRFEGLALQTAGVQEVAVGRAGVTSEGAGSVQSAQEQEDGALMVTHKVRFTWRTEITLRSAHVCYLMCVCVSLVCVWAHLKRWFWDTPAGRRLRWRRSQCGHELLSVQRLRTESTACNTATLTWGHEGLLLFNKYFLGS